jgi:hypothetical protein
MIASCKIGFLATEGARETSRLVFMRCINAVETNIANAKPRSEVRPVFAQKGRVVEYTPCIMHLG